MQVTHREVDIPVSTTVTRPIVINCAGFEWVFIYVKNTGATALNAFSVSRGISDDRNGGTFNTRFVVADSAAEFADPTLIGCVGPTGATVDPTTLAGGAEVSLQLPTFGCDAIELRPTVASGSTVLAALSRGN